MASVGIVVTAAYSLRAINQMFLGAFNARWEHLSDLNTREVLTLAPLVLLMVGLGIFPGAALALMANTLNNLAAAFK